MKIKGKHYRAAWMKGKKVSAIDQTLLPFEVKIIQSENYQKTAQWIKDMHIRGAGTIGAVAGFAMAQAAQEAPKSDYQPFLGQARQYIEKTRPTARDLFAAVEHVYDAALRSRDRAIKKAQDIADYYVKAAQQIAEEGGHIIEANGQVLTHCNAGWLALLDYGSALAPIFEAQRQSKAPFVYVDETRPRNQGALLTAFELENEGIAHTIIADSAAAYFMAQGKIDLVIVGADRIAANGDVANKIGTLEKAIAAKYFDLPFYVAAPTRTFDPNTPNGQGIPVEFRNSSEITHVKGYDANHAMHTVQIANNGSEATNPAFDITPARLITGIITEKGIIKANQQEIKVMLED